MASHRNEAVRVFIVEDSPAIRDRYRAELQTMEHVELCGEAATASDAISGIRDAHPAVVLLDLELEQGSGTQVLEALATLPPPPQFVVVTNHVEQEMKERCFRLGATHFFDKNRQFLELLDFLEQL